MHFKFRIMDLTKADFGALLDVFIQEFNCDRKHFAY